MENAFVARPVNGMSKDVGATKLRATFRVADWGSQPIVVPRPADWRSIGDATNAARIAAGQPGVLSTLWTRSETERCDDGVPAPGQTGCGAAKKDDHQCVLVELPGDASLGLVNDSILCNMDFASASVLSRRAQISVRGLSALPGTTSRDVYLYVKRRNMPSAYGSKQLTPLAITVKRIAALLADLVRDFGGEKMPPDVARLARRYRRVLEVTQTDTGDVFGAIRALQVDVIQNVMPTYEVHAFHDSGRTIKDDDRTLKVLTPQTGFGFVVQHPRTGNGVDERAHRRRADRSQPLQAERAKRWRENHQYSRRRLRGRRYAGQVWQVRLLRKIRHLSLRACGKRLASPSSPHPDCHCHAPKATAVAHGQCLGSVTRRGASTAVRKKGGMPVIARAQKPAKEPVECRMRRWVLAAMQMLSLSLEDTSTPLVDRSCRPQTTRARTVKRAVSVRNDTGAGLE